MNINRRSAGIVLARQQQGEWYFLLLRAYHNWDFPKGMVEAGETSLQAAIRETAEETGITELDFRWGLSWQETEPYAQGKVARFYMAETRQCQCQLLINPQLRRPEHHEYRWMRFEEACTYLPSRLKNILQWARSVMESAPDNLNTDEKKPRTGRGSKDQAS